MVIILMVLILKRSKLTLNRQFLLLGCLHMTNNLAVNVEFFCDGNHLIGGLIVGVNLQAVAHVEHLVHFMPVGARGGLDHLEQGRQSQHVVFHDVQFVNEVQHLGLGAAAAMDDAVDLFAELLQYRYHQRGVGAGGREDELAYVNAGDFGRVGEFVRTGIDQVFRDAVVVAFIVFLSQIMVQHVVSCRGEAIAAHAAVVAVFVGGLSVRGKSHDDIAGL